MLENMDILHADVFKKQKQKKKTKIYSDNGYSD